MSGKSYIGNAKVHGHHKYHRNINHVNKG